jgi:O-antigen/teichoic acid export membrane protein
MLIPCPSSMNLSVIQQEIRKIQTSRLARITGWMMLGQILSYGAQAGYFIVLSRLLGVAQFGVLAGAVAFVQIFMPYGSMGSGIVFMRHASTNREKSQLYIGHIFLCSLAISGAIIVALWLAAPHVLNGEAASIVWMASVSSCFAAPLTIAISQVFQTYEMPKTMTSFNILNNTGRLIAALGLLAILHHAQARQWAMADMCVSLFVALTAALVVIRHFGTPKVSLPLFWQRLAEGFGYSTSLSASSIYNNFDKTVLSHYGMNVANGFYSLAYRVTNLATMPSYSIEMAAIPQMFQRAQSDPRRFRAYGYSLIRRSAFLGAVVSVVLFFAAPILPHIVGSDFQASIRVLRWICLLPLFRSVHEIAGSMLTTAGFQRYRLGAQFSVAALTLGLDLWWIPRLGWLGAAWASLASDGALAVACFLLVPVAMSRARITPGAAS